MWHEIVVRIATAMRALFGRAISTGPHLILHIGRADPTYGRLANFAARLKVLLDRPKVQADPYLSHTLDDFLGAIYALILAKSQDFTDRPAGTSPERDKVQIRAEQVANGHVRLGGKWMAGFHFNSALLRLSAVYHRILRVLTNDHRKGATVGDLRNKLAYGTWTGRPWSHANIQQIHTEVNALKHDSAGVGGGRNATYAHALDAVEELLDVLEACPHIR